MTTEERVLLLVVASVTAKLALESGRVADAEEIYEGMRAIEAAQREQK